MHLTFKKQFSCHIYLLGKSGSHASVVAGFGSECSKPHASQAQTDFITQDPLRLSICPGPTPAEMRAARLQGAARHPDLVVPLPRALSRSHARRRAGSDRMSQRQHQPRIIAVAAGECYLGKHEQSGQRHPHLGSPPRPHYRPAMLQGRCLSRPPRRRRRPTRSGGRRAAAAPAAPTSGALQSVVCLVDAPLRHTKYKPITDTELS